MGTIHIETDRTGPRSVEFDISPSLTARHLFSGESYRVSYPVDISDVDGGILAIPAVANICPVVWVCGHTLEVDALDRTFYESLREIRSGYQRILPETALSGSVAPATLTDANVTGAPQSNETSTEGILFSGGVDSTASYLRIADRMDSSRPQLIYIEKLFAQNRAGFMKSNVDAFAEAVGTEWYSIEANVRSILNEPYLTTKFHSELGQEWWTGIQYGIAYMGLCAPLTAALGISTLSQSSGFTTDPTYPTAQPHIINPIQWSTTQCHLDAPDLSRQEKVERIASEFETDGPPDFDVVSCTSLEPGNCGACEKCYRNILGFLAAGVDPNDIGYDCETGTLAEIRAAFERGELQLSEQQVRVYRDIQAAMESESVPFGQDFAEWFTAVDLSRFQKPSSTSRKREIFHAAPYPVSALSYMLYRRLIR